MLRVDLTRFSDAAQWSRLPTEIRAAGLESTVSDAAFPGAILPAADSEGTVYWYVGSETAHEWRALRRLLIAYTGPTISNFDGRTTELDRTNPVEQYLIDAGVQTAACIRTQSHLIIHASRALQRLVATHRQRPSGAMDVPRSTQQLLASVETCLTVGDRFGAEQLLAQLEREWRLDALNLRFLEVRILSHFRDWSAIVRAEWLAPLCQVRKPTVVALAILEALYRTTLEPLEADRSAQRDAYYRETRRFALPLFAQVASNAPVLKWYAGLEELPSAGPPGDRVTTVQRQILAAAETESVSVQRAALDELHGLDVEEQQQTLNPAPVRAALETVLPAQTSLAPPRDWLEWLETLSHPSNRTMEWALTGAAEWSPKDWADPGPANTLADALLAVPDGTALQRLAVSLPTFVRWIKSDTDFPRSSFRPVYDALLTQLLMLEARGHAEREAALDLFEALLTVGTSATQYARLLDDMGSLIDPGSGRSAVYWSFDLADLLIQYPTPNIEARLRLLSSVLSSLQGCTAIMTPAQRLSYAHVAAMAGWPPLSGPDSESVDATIEASLTGKTVVIYTLTESAARQAEVVLKQLCPGVRVELAHDHVASPRLERLAKNAEFFVMVAASAKHAATDCITRNRGGRPILYSVGRGFCSIIRAIENACG